MAYSQLLFTNAENVRTKYLFHWPWHVTYWRFLRKQVALLRRLLIILFSLPTTTHSTRVAMQQSPRPPMKREFGYNLTGIWRVFNLVAQYGIFHYHQWVVPLGIQRICETKSISSKIHTKFFVKMISSLSVTDLGHSTSATVIEVRDFSSSKDV